nr:hypothetical protein [Tanacetum cinerariifolium]
MDDSDNSVYNQMIVSTSMIFPSANSTEYLVSMVDGTMLLKELNSMEEKDIAFWFLRFGSCVVSLAFWLVAFSLAAFWLCDLVLRPNGEALRKCILSGPYKPTTVLVQAVAATDDSLAIPEHTIVETPMNMTPANKAHFEAEKEAIHLILTGIGDEISRLLMLAKQLRKCGKLSKDTDEEIDEQELEAHYSYMAKIQEVPTADSGTNSEPLEQVQNDAGYNVFANDLQHTKQSEYVSNTCLVETDDSNVIHDSPDMCNDDIQNDQNDVESDDERVALANLKLDVDENKKIQKQLKKANTTLAQELKECKTILAETSKTLGESNSV